MSVLDQNSRRRRRAYRAAALPRPFNVATVNLLVMVTLVAFFIGYLVLNNRAATKGFTIRAAEQRLTELEERGRRLDLETVSLQSMRSIEQHVGELGFVPVTQVDYLNAASAVAVK
ncbi:hypothetical protein AMJ57_04090 [Parcubacteria bacterium SG8_24]|nr:MAG: hypothetical protein AMJ57_04090 [Parcubacteria bacterium SG8_24]